MTLRLGTRGSALALAQAEHVAALLGGEVELVPITTSGDRGAGGDKARFVKEIEEALLAGEVDLAVHSAKDVPAELPDGLSIVGVPGRADPRDAICGAASVGELAEGATVGTSSLRRRAQLLALRPDLQVLELHGNVDTRLRRLADGDYDALVLAAAGLERLGRGGEGDAVPAGAMVPAPGQGCLALEARRGDERAGAAAAAVTERSALRAADRRAGRRGRARGHLPHAHGRACRAAGRAPEAHGLRGPAGRQRVDHRLPRRGRRKSRRAGARGGGAAAGGRGGRAAGGRRADAGSLMPTPGTVYLVGAGPGDPGLMTRRSLELIAEADAILHDRLIPDGALAGARPGCDLRYVGKRPGAPSMGQEEINALLVELGREGKSVVRLKGGDPFVFGRGGEEAQALAAAGVPFEVVPGVSAGVAASAYAGIPVTHRDTASAVAFVTGHEDPDKGETAIDWEALARFPGTLVFYMGVKSLPLIAERLTAAGRDPDEPAAVVAQGTLPGQRTVAGTLAGIAALAQEAGVKAPAITVVGAVAGLSDTLAWLERRPLHGEIVAVTRARAQASTLAARLRALGAEVVEAPAIRIEPRRLEPAALEGIGDYSLICVTSPNGAALLLAALGESGLDARALAGATLAAIGPGTAAELARGGLSADVVPERSVAEALVEALAGVQVDGSRVLVARAAEARDVLPDALAGRGAEVDVLALYDTVAEPASDATREALARATYVTFTSSSTVRFFMDATGGPPAAARIVSIGPVTSETARERGLTVHVEAGRHDIDGLVDALVDDVAERRAGRP